MNEREYSKVARVVMRAHDSRTCVFNLPLHVVVTGRGQLSSLVMCELLAEGRQKAREVLDRDQAVAVLVEMLISESEIQEEAASYNVDAMYVTQATRSFQNGPNIAVQEDKTSYTKRKNLEPSIFSRRV